METGTITKKALVLNYVEIAITIVYYLLVKVTNTAFQSTSSAATATGLATAVTLCQIIIAIASVVVIVMTIILMKKSEKKVKGLGFLLTAGIITLIFAISGYILGIVIWIFCGLSIKGIKQKDAEDSFEAKLDIEISADNDEIPVAEEVPVVEEVPAVEEVTTTESEL